LIRFSRAPLAFSPRARIVNRKMPPSAAQLGVHPTGGKGEKSGNREYYPGFVPARALSVRTPKTKGTGFRIRRRQRKGSKSLPDLNAETCGIGLSSVSASDVGCGRVPEKCIGRPYFPVILASGPGVR